MNCEECVNGTYFQNVSSHNCIPKPDNGFYIGNDGNTLLPCHSICKTCYQSGTDEENNCLSCYGDSYLENTNCVDDDPFCLDIGCGRCDSQHNKTDTCQRCSYLTNYYPLEQFKNQDFVFCSNYTPKHFYFNKTEKKYRLCFQTCQSCTQLGNDNDHKCISCDKDFTFIGFHHFVSIPESPRL
jgi:hypothetical protein